MKKIGLLTTISLSTILVLGVASCSPTTPGETITGGGETTSGATSKPGASGEELRIDFWNDAVSDPALEQLAERFENIIWEQEGVNINISISGQGNYDTIKDKIYKSFTNNTQPTMAIAYPDHVADYLEISDGKYVVNINDYINDAEIGLGKDDTPGLSDIYTLEESYVTSFIEEGKKFNKEGLYIFPYLKSTEVLVYNVNLLKGLVVPGLNDGREILTGNFMKNLTWDDFVVILKYINENKDSLGYDSLQWPLYYDSDSNFFINKMMQNDIPFLANASTPHEQVLFNNDAAKAEIQELKDLFDEGILMTKESNGGFYGSNYFNKEEILFTISSSGGVGYQDLGFDNEVGVVKVPHDKNIEYVSQGPSIVLLKNPNIAKDEEKIQYAWRFLKFITNEENNAYLAASSNGYIPVNETSYDNDVFLSAMEEEDAGGKYTLKAKNYQCVIEDIQGRYYNLPVFKGTAIVRNSVGGILNKVFNNLTTLEDAFNTAYQESIIAVSGSSSEGE